MAESLVVGVDGSAMSQVAVEVAGKLAKDLGDKVYVVFGYEPQRVAEIQDHRAALEELGEKFCARAIGHLEELGVECEARLVDTGPVDALISVADQYDSRMIAVGSYGDSPLKGALLGSTPHKLVHLSRRPVLVVRGADD